MPDGSGGFTSFAAFGNAVDLHEGWAYSICGTKSASTTQYWVYMVTVDLSDLGVANGAAINALRFSTPDGADPIVIAPIHTGPPLPVANATWGKVKSLYR